MILRERETERCTLLWSRRGRRSKRRTLVVVERERERERPEKGDLLVEY
jgi:hypothetical protein